MTTTTIAGPETSADPLLSIERLQTHFPVEGGVVKAVDDISLTVRRGRTLGVVGESGSGKSVTSLSVMRLLPNGGTEIVGGRIAWMGRDLVRASQSDLQEIRGAQISMIFQEPGTSLNPVYRVGWQVEEAIRLHEAISRDEARQRTIALFREVGIPEPERRVDSYPHEMSGGQKQRVMIAMALSCNPELLIADEPTTALDVTIQAQILELLRGLQQSRQMAMMFITHDLGVIARIADDVAVMYRGKVVEYGPAGQIFESPAHPYTQGLLACRPKLHATRRRLPTVADFMEVRPNERGEPVIVPKTPSPERLKEIEGRGRARLLHPKPELVRLGYDPQTLSLPTGTEYVPEGAEPLLDVRDLQVHFPIQSGFFRRTTGWVKAVDGVSFRVYRGQTLGFVGESGCGKTTTGRALVRLVEPRQGTVHFASRDWLSLRGNELRKARRRLQIVFQDPFASLNPRLSIDSMLVEAMAVHGLGASAADRRDRAAALLQEVGLLPEHLRRYPHEFSGGQRQRLCIARALAVEPELLVCDESVSALDVSVQAQVLNLLKDLQEKRGLTYIFISHDLGVVKFMSDMMVVMNQGRFVEYGPSDAIYAAPREEYTRKLIAAIPDVTGRRN